MIQVKKRQPKSSLPKQREEFPKYYKSESACMYARQSSERIVDFLRYDNPQDHPEIWLGFVRQECGQNHSVRDLLTGFAPSTAEEFCTVLRNMLDKWNVPKHLYDQVKTELAPEQTKVRAHNAGNTGNAGDAGVNYVKSLPV